MTEWWRHAALGGGDLIFGWLLHLPSDAALLLLAVASAVLVVVVRRLTTNQDLLARCAADRKRLRQLLRAARARRDDEEVARLRATRSRVSLKQLRAELAPLACLILPVAFLANWAWHRFEFHPPRAGEDVELRVTFPGFSAGDAAHLVPQPGLEAPRGWIRRIEPVPAGRSTAGLARWTVRFAGGAGPTPLLVRHRLQTFDWIWRHDGGAMDPPVKEFKADGVRMEVALSPVRLFGAVPGLPWLGLPAWLVGYLMLTLLFVAALKRWWKVS